MLLLRCFLGQAGAGFFLRSFSLVYKLGIQTTRLLVVNMKKFILKEFFGIRITLLLIKGQSKLVL